VHHDRLLRRHRGQPAARAHLQAQARGEAEVHPDHPHADRAGAGVLRALPRVPGAALGGVGHRLQRVGGLQHVPDDPEHGAGRHPVLHRLQAVPGPGDQRDPVQELPAEREAEEQAHGHGQRPILEQPDRRDDLTRRLPFADSRLPFADWRECFASVSSFRRGIKRSQLISEA